jgi:predicted O-methyltransferase YrrM
MKTAKSRETFLKNFKHSSPDTTRDDARFLRILVASTGAKRGIEVGCCHAFGAMNMGIAFERNGGRLTSIEVDPERATICRANLAKLGLEKTVTVIEGDALKILPTLKGELDFVFLDAVKQDYLRYFKALRPRLKVGALVVADNVIKHAEAMKNFLDFMQSSPAWDTVILRASMDKGDGMAVSCRIR